MLKAQQDSGLVMDFARADEDDTSPHDFSATLASGSEVLICVKSAAGDFSAPVSISTPELILMRDSAPRFDLYYVFGFEGRNATLRVATDLRGFAQRLLPLLASFPDAIVPESFAVNPEVLSFGEAEILRIPHLKTTGPTATLAKPQSVHVEETEEILPSEPTAASLSDLDVDQIMAAFRTELRGSPDLTERELLRAVGRRLGFNRLGKNVWTALKGHLRAAIRRQIVARDEECLFLATPLFRQYELPFLVKTTRAVMRPGLDYERDEVIRLVTRYLGFTYPTRSIQEQMKSAFNSAIRQGLLEYQGSTIARK